MATGTYDEDERSEGSSTQEQPPESFPEAKGARNERAEQLYCVDTWYRRN